MPVDVVILAAGKGTRMKSILPKVLHPLGGQPLVLYSVRTATAVSAHLPVLVIGHEGEAVQHAVGEAARYVTQAEQLGTGHAVMQARCLLEGTGDYVIVTYADMPLLRAETLERLVEVQGASNGPFSLLTHITDTPRGFGRIMRDDGDNVIAIIEEAQASPEELDNPEVNVGVYCFDAGWLWSHLDDIPKNAVKGEYYLTDLVEIAVREGGEVRGIPVDDADEVIGINTRVDLADTEAALRRRVNEALMLEGVTILDPTATYIQPGVKVGRDSVILPNTYLKGQTIIGEGCQIGPNTTIEDSTIGNGCRVFQSVIEQATMEDGVDIGPFGHLRKGAYLESGVHMGNFGEVKNSRLRRGVKMGHFSYLGDADIGEDSNIGAGTITCNYDGVNKNKTTVGKDVFIGSDTMLVAPVSLGDGAHTGAGSVVTRDVAPGDLVYGVPARARSAGRPVEEKSAQSAKQEE